MAVYNQVEESQLLAADGGYWHNKNFRKALLVALVLHLVLALIFPDLPEMNFPSLSRGTGITVFLRKAEESKQFEQSLNQQYPVVNTEQLLQQPAVGSANPKVGDNSVLTEETPQLKSQRFDTSKSDIAGQQSQAKLQPSIRIDRAAIKIFSQQEAVREVERNPRALERFKRSFNSRRNYQRRSRAESYQDRYGDQYVRATTSTGDICFLQEAEDIPSDFVTNTVYFFRCDKKPFRLDIEANRKAEQKLRDEQNAKIESDAQILVP